MATQVAMQRGIAPTRGVWMCLFLDVPSSRACGWVFEGSSLMEQTFTFFEGPTLPKQRAGLMIVIHRSPTQYDTSGVVAILAIVLLHPGQRSRGRPCSTGPGPQCLGSSLRFERITSEQRVGGVVSNICKCINPGLDREERDCGRELARLASHLFALLPVFAVPGVGRE